MKKVFLVLALLMGASSAYCSQTVCSVGFQPDRGVASVGGVGWVAVSYASDPATCATGPTTTGYLLATGTTQFCSSAVASPYLYPEATLMSLSAQLQQAMTSGRKVSITGSGYPCQIGAVYFF